MPWKPASLYRISAQRPEGFASSSVPSRLSRGVQSGDSRPQEVRCAVSRRRGSEGRPGVFGVELGGHVGDSRLQPSMQVSTHLPTPNPVFLVSPSAAPVRLCSFWEGNEGKQGNQNPEILAPLWGQRPPGDQEAAKRQGGGDCREWDSGVGVVTKGTKSSPGTWL